MIKQNPGEDSSGVALEVPEVDLVDWDLHETSLYRFYLKTLHKVCKYCNVKRQKNIYYVVFDEKQNPAVHHQDAALGVLSTQTCMKLVYIDLF